MRRSTESSQQLAIRNTHRESTLGEGAVGEAEWSTAQLAPLPLISSPRCCSMSSTLLFPPSQCCHVVHDSLTASAAGCGTVRERLSTERHSCEVDVRLGQAITYGLPARATWLMLFHPPLLSIHAASPHSWHIWTQTLFTHTLI